MTRGLAPLVLKDGHVRVHRIATGQASLEGVQAAALNQPGGAQQGLDDLTIRPAIGPLPKGASPTQLREALQRFLREGGAERLKKAFGGDVAGASIDHLVALAEAQGFFEKNANQPLVAPAPRGATTDWTMSSNHLFRASYFVRNSHRLDALEAQPWLEWSPGTKRYELKTTGADAAILKALGKVTLYRGTHRLEAELLLGAKALLRGSSTGRSSLAGALGEALQTWTLSDEQRAQLTQMAAELPSLWAAPRPLRREAAGRLLLAFEPDRSGFIATTPRKDIAEIFAFHRGEMDSRLGRVLSFEVDLGALPTRIRRGVYGGIEALDIGSSPEDLHLESFHEISFRSLEAKLRMLEGLRDGVETERDYRPSLTAER